MASEKERSEKYKIAAQIKHVPKDAQVVMSIMNELNVRDYDSRVINQLLEFTYRYVTCVLDDAKVFANHARKKTIDVDDVNLATDVVEDTTFTAPPARNVLAKLAEVRNAMPLPPIKTHCGLRLPPDRYCLSSCNYKLRAKSHNKKASKSSTENRSNIKTHIKNMGGKNNSGNRTTTPAKNSSGTAPKPVIKFTATSKLTSEEKDDSRHDEEIKIESESNVVSSSSMAGNDTTIVSTSVSTKREREEDDYEDIN